MERVIYGFYESELGTMLVAKTEVGICWVGFVREGEQKIDAVEALKKRFPKISLLQNDSVGDNLGRSIMRAWESDREKELDLDLRGTEFQKEVWLALMSVAKGFVCSYSEVAEIVNRPDAVRAVGTAVGANPVSLIVPCHRVIQKGGRLGSYAWGSELKEKILLQEGVSKDLIKRL